MKKNKQSLTSSPFLPIELEVSEQFRVRIPTRVIENRKKDTDQMSGEYFTVTYNTPMTRKGRRLLLQTVLDSVIRKDPLLLNLGEYIIIEDLTSKIIENDSVENEQQLKYKRATEELLGIALMFLRAIPLTSRVEPEIPEPNLREFILALVYDECEFFSFSSDQTYGSRIATYHPARSVEFTVEIPLQDDEGFFVPYSSYCKGYGESHPKHVRTPVDWEIDGEDTSNFEESQSIIPVDFYNRLWNRQVEEYVKNVPENFNDTD